jgi:outer membrane lipoprotein-sorting protein
LSLFHALFDAQVYLSQESSMHWAVLLFWSVAVCSAAEADAILSKWLGQQTNLQTWTADFVQTRTLKTLAQPLVSTGQVWFAAPQNFRWELGRDQTIAIRNDDTMLVLYPRLKRAERYQFELATGKEWKETLSLLQSGFPRSRQDFNRQFTVRGAMETNDLVRLELEPKAPGARKLMPRINLFIAPKMTLAGTELVFADGSSMRNDFKNARTNAPAEGRFDLGIPPDFKLVEPLRDRAQ